ncbi:MAG: hypothetical protein K1X68_05920 [Saprospiraceae bacterium]|nr:hypothetical protein [Saprospiraceae bacterium]HMW38778.1 hypothetical protein [Saprospiraceae bacterium]HMX88683.1 hypothetical protein [Saprospiraceae bacterium]HMZ40115.1 hypothetical protein [Saprospiraceae bacterium]HNB29646.1 hypothetical protein [Saprospiraceae bacterium]
MKTKITFSVMALLCLLIRSLTAQSLEQKVLNALSTLDQSQVPSQILYERSLEYLPLKSIDGWTQVDTINTSMFQLGLAHGMMEFAYVDTSHRANIDPYFDLIDQVKANQDTIPIGLLLYTFDRFKPWAIDSNLIYTSNNQFYDVIGRNQLPYLSDTTIIMSVGTGVSHKKEFKLRFHQDLFKTNMNSGIDSILIYVDDGTGWIRILPDQIVDVSYSDYDTYIIKMKVYLNDGTIRYTSDILVIEPETSGFAMPEGYSSSPDGNFHIGPQGTGVTAYYFIGNKCNDGKIRKPFILLEGFDPAGKYNWDFAMKSPNGILLRDYSLNEALSKTMKKEDYDIFFINYDNGSQNIFENAKWVREAIIEINKRKHEAGSTESNVVVGASMGGLVGKIALRKMELDGPAHETESYISFDSPLLGANIPLGMQMMVDHLGNHEVFFKKLKDRQEALGAGYNALNSTAAKQMLYYHASLAEKHNTPSYELYDGTAEVLGAYHTTFMNQLNALGNLNIPHYGIANGSIVKQNGKGIGMKFEPGDVLMNENICLSCGEWTGLIVGLNHLVEIKAITNGSWVTMYEGTIHQKFLALDFKDARLFTGAGFLPYDSAPGGLRIFNSIGEDGNEEETGHDWIYQAFCFIPTVSALAINLSDPYFQAVTLTNKEYVLNNGYT